MFLQRQISASCVDGQKEYLSDASKFPYKLTDVLPKYVLQLGEGAVTSDYIRLDASTSYSVPLPSDYDSDDILSCVFRSTARCRIELVSPDHGTSTLLLKSTYGSIEGDHFGMIMWQGKVTSITVDVPSGFDPALIDYFCFKVPDLDDPNSYQIGDRAIGYVSVPL